ncbi:MAG: T9SS type A sorting domain-containing protein [Panacibacter sp.]
MRKLSFLILMSLFFAKYTPLQAQLKTEFDQLIYVNHEWLGQLGVNPALKENPVINVTEEQIVQLHLLETEKLLRSRSVNNLSAEQQNRLRTLNVLHQYILAGKFPQNTLHINRQPYFIDAENNYCAVGYLMKMSGADEMAKRISSLQNFNYLIDIHDPGLMKWVSKTGLTFDELALIQPGYGGEWPACIIEMHYNNAGKDTGEYIEVHQSAGVLIGMEFFQDILFYDNAGVLYKTLNINQMQKIGASDIQHGYLYYQFPANENFADKGKISLKGNKVLSTYTYDSSSLILEDFYFKTTRQYDKGENTNTPLGSSLTFCGKYVDSTWKPDIVPITFDSLNDCVINVLPISLTSFNSFILNKSIQLNWQTASENNTNYFEIERSSDGRNFTSLGKTKAAGQSSTIKKYSYTDVAPMYINHYRLKQVDNDGKFTYSKIIFAKQPKAIPFTLLQTQVGNNLKVQVDAILSAIGYFTIYDLSGRAIIKIKATSGSENINTGLLAPGKYLICLDMKDGQAYTRQFVKN